MNTMNRFTNATKAQKITIIVLSVLITAVVVYGAAAFTTRSWPFSNTVEEKPVVDADKDLLQVKAKVATTQQGSCKLTLSNKDNIFVITNTTEGVEGQKGCLEYNIGTNNIPAGTYDLEVKFIGKTETATTNQVVSIP
jgi:hypothetical protein